MCNGSICALEDSYGRCVVRGRKPSFAACQRSDDDPLYATFTRGPGKPGEDDEDEDGIGPTVPLWRLEEHLERGRAATPASVTA